MQIFHWMNNKKNFLVILTNPGTGKTHLCSAMMDWGMRTFHHVRYYNERTFLSKIRESFHTSPDDYIGYLKSMIDDDLIILDDIGSEKHNEWREEVLLETVDERYNSGKPTIFTSNLCKTEFINRYHHRLCDRLFDVNNTIIEDFELPSWRKGEMFR